jgi:hypothetical protein
MRIISSLLLVLFVVAVACNKDKFQTRPTVTVKSITNDYIPLNGTTEITLEVTDKEGDVQDTLLLIKKRLNKRVVPTIRDTIRYGVPDFPTKQKSEYKLTLDYQSILSAQNPPFIPGSNPAQRELDTLVLRLVVKDNAGNVSDTIETKPIHVYRQ